AYIDKLKEMDEQGERSYSLRYIGSLVAGFHRNLIQGGVFLYPRDKKSTDKPDGKLRLLYEAAPLALVAEEAGGMAITDDGRRILDIEPKDLHQRVALVIGSRDEVTLAEEYFKKG
ncbi:MAG: class 1 fructose-bisphosphatase, partial [Candidatus Electrothrix sp. AR1]|nr:class 1 fructose-bisphosphatase [Candidatus Electrothrix sp. AR1]